MGTIECPLCSGRGCWNCDGSGYAKTIDRDRPDDGTTLWDLLNRMYEGQVRIVVLNDKEFKIKREI